MADLTYKKKFIQLEVENDGEGNALHTIKLDDEQELTITIYELAHLKEILDENFNEILEYSKNLEQE